MSLKTKSFMEFKLRQSYFQNEAFALEDRLADNKRKMGSLRDRLYQINNFNDDIFDILEKSLSYLKETVDPYLREVDCPVCGDSHERKALLGKIERKLTQGSKKVKELKKKLFLENQNAVRIIDHYQIEERGLKDDLTRRINRLKNLMINNSFMRIKNTEELEKRYLSFWKEKIAWQLSLINII